MCVRERVSERERGCDDFYVNSILLAQRMRKTSKEHKRHKSLVKVKGIHGSHGRGRDSESYVSNL